MMNTLGDIRGEQEEGLEVVCKFWNAEDHMIVILRDPSYHSHTVNRYYSRRDEWLCSIEEPLVVGDNGATADNILADIPKYIGGLS